MKSLIFVLAMISCADSFAVEPSFFIKIGVGYKINEQKALPSSPASARIEMGIDNINYDGLSIGVAHHSQWTTGAPFNDEQEAFKTEFFIDYTWRWGL